MVIIRRHVLALAAAASVVRPRAAWAANTTWNPADKTSGITLSNGNLTATANAINNAVRSVNSQSTGKFYWEVTCTLWSSSCGAGIALLSAPLLPTPINAVIVNQGNGIIFNNAVNTGASLGASTVVTGVTLGIAVDFIAGLAWFRVAPAGNWNGSGTGNPATGAIGVNFAPISSGGTAQFFGWTCCNGGTNATTANFGDSAFTGAVPSGFTAGFPSSSSSAGTARNKGDLGLGIN
jgi:hypothetical protein